MTDTLIPRKAVRLTNKKNNLWRFAAILTASTLSDVHLTGESSSNRIKSAEYDMFSEYQY